MTVLSLELMDITQRLCFLLCQAFTAANFSCCLFVGFSAFSFVFSEWNAAQSGWNREIDLAPGLLLLYGLGSMKRCPINFA